MSETDEPETEGEPKIKVSARFVADVELLEKRLGADLYRICDGDASLVIDCILNLAASRCVLCFPDIATDKWQAAFGEKIERMRPMAKMAQEMHRSGVAVDQINDHLNASAREELRKSGHLAESDDAQTETPAHQRQVAVLSQCAHELGATMVVAFVQREPTVLVVANTNEPIGAEVVRIVALMREEVAPVLANYSPASGAVDETEVN